MNLSGTDADHAPAAVNSVRLRNILRWWPLLLATMVIAIGAAGWAHQRQVPSYTSTARMVVIPLPQWDETFLGTDLVRDSGDATRTAPTLATELKSGHYQEAAARFLGGDWTRQSVGDAVRIAATGETNIVEIVARASDPDTASRLASGFVDAAMADRWQTISTQLDSRIAALREGGLAAAGDQQGDNPAAAELAGRLRTLSIVRASGADPTLRIGPASPAMPESQMSLPVTMALAALGGLFVGLLAATGIEVLRRSRVRPGMPGNHNAQNPLTFSRNGNSRAHANSR